MGDEIQVQLNAATPSRSCLPRLNHMRDDPGGHGHCTEIHGCFFEAEVIVSRKCKILYSRYYPRTLALSSRMRYVTLVTHSPTNFKFTHVTLK